LTDLGGESQTVSRIGFKVVVCLFKVSNVTDVTCTVFFKSSLQISVFTSSCCSVSRRPLLYQHKHCILWQLLADEYIRKFTM